MTQRSVGRLLLTTQIAEALTSRRMVRPMGGKTEFGEDTVKVFGRFGSRDSSDEFAFSGTGSDHTDWLGRGAPSNSTAIKRKGIASGRATIAEVSSMGRVHKINKLVVREVNIKRFR
jgi:hypothetical protein